MTSPDFVPHQDRNDLFLLTVVVWRGISQKVSNLILPS
jgi:hypothetical protein